ncbi:MAG: dTDP-glucose 4,6-dehydratase [Rhodospirillaceae bacterium]|nr:dTDP-glucose 4,6-dehydratase [Rhodospirillaceae bacterium]
MTILVTGGAGFIGSNFVIDWLTGGGEPVLVLDKLTYAGNPANLDAFRNDVRLTLATGDIGDQALVSSLLAEHRPRAIVHFAAESHVDRSIAEPEAFIQTNVVGTYRLLAAALGFWRDLPEKEQRDFRFLHVSTDEVYGSLEPSDPAFAETNPHKPNSPYSASKAASDHLARAWFHTYGLPVLTTNCSNNYGPYQFPEKLIPLIIRNALAGRRLPIYGDGGNVRDWIYVADHCAGIRRVLEAGIPGEIYNLGGAQEKTNLEVVHTICSRLDAVRPLPDGRRYADQITFVTDRPGHDRRYAIDGTKALRELGWGPAENFASGIEKTIAWYLDHADWVENIASGAYRDWMERQYRGTGA